jgi:hypothetical protein
MISIESFKAKEERRMGSKTNLVVIGEGDDGSADAENHTRMNLAMSERMREGGRLDPRRDVELVPSLLPDPLHLPLLHVLRSARRRRGRQILRRHRNHDGLFLFRIEQLDLALLEEMVPRVVVRVLLPELLVRRVGELGDVLLLEHKLLALLVNNEERTADPPSVGVEPELLFTDVPDDGDLGLDVGRPTELDEVLGELVRVPMDSDPHSVDEDLCRARSLAVLLEAFDSPLVEELEDGRRVGSDGDVRHEGEVLDETAGLTFGRLGRADHAPVSVVELTGLGDLSVSTDGGVATTEMGEGRSEGVSVEDLGDSRSGLHRLFLVSPVSGGERVLETVRDGRRSDGGFELEFLSGLDALKKTNEDETLSFLSRPYAEWSKKNGPSGDVDRRPWSAS